MSFPFLNRSEHVNLRRIGYKLNLNLVNVQKVFSAVLFIKIETGIQRKVGSVFLMIYFAKKKNCQK